MTPQQLVNVVRNLNSQNSQQNTKAPTPYYLQVASTQTPSTLVHRNTQMMYPHVGGLVPMQQCLRPFDGSDPTYTAKYILNCYHSKHGNDSRTRAD